MSRIVLLGGGISNLSCAYYLRQNCSASSIQVLEANSKVGGWMKTAKHDQTGALCELGPRSLKNKQTASGANLKQLIFELNLMESVLPVDVNASKKLLFIGDKVHNWRDYLFSQHKSFGDFFKFVKSFGIPAWKFVNKVQNKDFSEFEQMTIGDLARLTDDEKYQKLGNYPISALPRGIYAGDANKISLDTLIPLQGSYPDAVPNKKVRIERKLEITNKSLEEYINYTIASEKMDARSVLNGNFKDMNDVFNKAKEHGEMFARQKESMKQLGKLPIIQFQHGMQTLTTALAEECERDNVNIETRARVTKINFENNEFKIETNTGKIYFADKVVSGLPAPALSRLLLPSDDAFSLLGRMLSKIDTVPVATVTFSWDKSKKLSFPEVCNNAFGHLVPPSENDLVLGIIYDSNLTEYRDNSDMTQVTVMLGGAWWDSHALNGTALGFVGDCDENSELHAKCKEIALDACHKQLGYLFAANEPDLTHVSVLDEAIPQYYVGHKKLVNTLNQTIHQSILKDKFFLNGNAFYGVGVPDTILAAKYVSYNVLNHLNVNS